MDRRLSRRKPATRLALSIGALVLAVPGVASCGFDYATDRENDLSNGAHSQDSVVDVLNAVIVSKEDGSGTFIATLVNGSADEAISMDSLSFGSSSTVQVAGFSAVEVPPHGLVNLANGGGVKVAGDELTAGKFLHVTVGFDNGETSSVNVQVVTAEDDYAGLDNGTGEPSPTATESAE